MHWMHRHRLLILAGIALFWTGMILVAHRFEKVPFLSGVWRSELGFEDLLRREGRKTPTRSDFVFVGIDQSSMSLKAVGDEEKELFAKNPALVLMTERPFPWSREVWGLLLDRLFSSGARL